MRADSHLEASKIIRPKDDVKLLRDALPRVDESGFEENLKKIPHGDRRSCNATSPLY